MDINFITFVFIFLVANIIEATTGFGSTIITVALGANFYPIPYILSTIIPLNIVLNIYISFRHFCTINHKILWKVIFPVTLIGMPFGILIFNFVGSNVLKIMYGIFVFLLSVVELNKIFKKNTVANQSTPSSLKSGLFLMLGGIVQGAWASGGPLVVYYASKKLQNKQAFRSTLSLLWLMLNVILVLNYILTNKINFDTIKTSIILLPVLVLGIIIGEHLHKQIQEKSFRIFVFVLLLVAGISLIIRG